MDVGLCDLGREVRVRLRVALSNLEDAWGLWWSWGGFGSVGVGYSLCLVVLVELRGLLLCMRAISVCVRVWLLRRNR